MSDAKKKKRRGLRSAKYEEVRKLVGIDDDIETKQPNNQKIEEPAKVSSVVSSKNNVKKKDDSISDEVHKDTTQHEATSSPNSMKNNENASKNSLSGGKIPVKDKLPSGKTTGKRTKQQQAAFVEEAKYLTLKIAIVVIAIATVLLMIFGMYRSSDLYMSPMVKNGDLVIYYRFDKQVSAGDLVAFNHEGQETCARVVAGAGDTVDIDEKGLIINGSHQVEQDIFYETTQIVNGVNFPLTVPENQVFVLGDNRKRAVDSRIYGCISLDKVDGQVVGVFRRREF